MTISRVSRIISTGSYLPARVLLNADLETMVDTTDEWIQERTGIKQRHIIADDQVTSDLAVAAAKQAIERAGLAPNDIDLVLVATTTPDKIFPSTATIVQRELGITNSCPAFDLQAVCTGFVYALSVADQFIKTGMVKRALVIGAESLSRITNWSDRSNCILWGDGAGAVILESTETGEPSAGGIIATHIHADGQYEQLLHVPTGPSRLAQSDDVAERTMNMKGNEVFKVAVNTLSRIATETLEKNNINASELDWLVPHQANLRIIKATGKKLGLADNQVVITVDRHGNTSSASIPLALDQAISDGRIQRGQLMLLEAFGGGFTWGSALIRY
ncbi:beta-ketoacyl-ACP synthase III [Thiomicrospira cyclica]|uniref:Beta-ketoacyl-[acyl-carrier-protein] synthase III n=1 Tax=Thiomicrospira cyclica (strain DSM 14477 / JCM 11371 / ALM1) TaxID=717773 RepID=F6D8R1_THICA|nr:beta-ketoacyl-ACP synthase III [Thiomicrospira cyclica]AEG31912.1 3-oxoacyl-(acyl-carrier-protein) synthase 3 [Thiomicrospira cyclica ALM1]